MRFSRLLRYILAHSLKLRIFFPFPFIKSKNLSLASSYDTPELLSI
jgi:hypothetical protein